MGKKTRTRRTKWRRLSLGKLIHFIYLLFDLILIFALNSAVTERRMIQLIFFKIELGNK